MHPKNDHAPAMIRCDELSDALAKAGGEHIGAHVPHRLRQRWHSVKVRDVGGWLLVEAMNKVFRVQDANNCGEECLAAAEVENVPRVVRRMCSDASKPIEHRERFCELTREVTRPVDAMQGWE